MNSGPNRMGSYYLPNFGVSLVASAVMLCIFVAWIFSDYQFSDSVELGLIDLRLKPHPGLKQSIMDEIHAELRWRILLLGALSVLAGASTLWTVVRLFVGRSEGRTIAAMLMATALIGGWLCLFTQFEKLVESGIKWRIKRQLPELASLATQLKTAWPKEDIEFAPYGTFRVDKGYPDILMAPENEEQSFTDKMGHFVWKKQNAILFEFHSELERPFLVEFHEGDSQPASLKNIFPNPGVTYELKSTDALGNGVFLSRYEMVFDEAELDKN